MPKIFLIGKIIRNKTEEKIIGQVWVKGIALHLNHELNRICGFPSSLLK